jgi:CBS domain-containing protein
MKVSDVMSRGVVSVRPETPIKEVARLMATYGISGVPVVDELDTIVGVISEADFLIKEDGVSRGTNRLERIIGKSGHTKVREAKVGATTAVELMSAPPLLIGPDASLREAAALMVDRRVNRLPVARGGRLLGIVTRADLVRAYLRPDDELLRQINEEIIRNTLWVDPATIEVGVREGVVSLSGALDRRSTAEWLASLVRRIEGVVTVESDLRWDLDDREIRLPEMDVVARGYVR